MQLADLLVSYKQVRSPKYNFSDNSYSFEFPSYNQFSSNEIPNEETTEETIEETPTEVKYFTTIGLSPKKSKEDKGSKNRWISPYITKKSQWVSDMTAAYKRAGLNDNAIKNLIAKNALESGWGKSAQGNYNFGNITTGSGWKGSYVIGRDKNSKGESISQKFRSYDSIDDYVRDEIQFLTKLYDFDQNDTFDQFINKLQGQNSGKRFYAEARDYKDKVREVYNSINGTSNS